MQQPVVRLVSNKSAVLRIYRVVVLPLRRDIFIPRGRGIANLLS